MGSTATHAADAEPVIDKTTIVVIGKMERTIENAPSTAVSISAEQIADTVNAVNVEDTLKYVPSLVIRKRSIGDNFAPIATRTAGLGSSARSLIYADGALLSALIANNNGNGSPKWNLVAPEEIDRIDILFGPFSAAYSGNSIGSVVNITTRMPDKLEARVSTLFNYQWHTQYKTTLELPSGQAAVSIGDKIGPFAFFLSETHTVSNAQPIVYATVTGRTPPTGTTGAISTFNRLNQPILVLGAGDIDHHVQDTIKLKTALDLMHDVKLRYTVGLFLDSSRSRLDSYLRNAAGDQVYTNAFNSGLYIRQQRHWAHAASLDGTIGTFDWQTIGSFYDYSKDLQSSPTATPAGTFPVAAYNGIAGSVVRQDGTGWWTLDTKGALRTGEADNYGFDANTLSFGIHGNSEKLKAQTYATVDWRGGVPGTRTAASLGRTRTVAIWAQDEFRIATGLVVTVGARYEWWRAFNGFNQTSAATPGIAQRARTETGFSPKLSVEWRPADPWSIKASFGQAYRFATVGELYQATTVGTVLANPNPNLRSERARSGELVLARRDQHGLLRLSLFDEVVDGALISQTAPVSVVQPNGSTITATVSFVQNVDQTRARGAEIDVERRDVLPSIDFNGNVTYSDSITSRNPVFPASVGKLLPSVPRWKAKGVITWRPDPRLALSAAARYSSRNYATLDNSDVYPDTYQGFDKYFVVDLRANFKVTPHWNFALGVDNVNNDRYFLFHPFPRRSITFEAKWIL